MFAFGEVPVKFVGLLVLFVWCTAWSVYDLTRPQNGRQRVSNVLHLVMAVVMLLMVSRPAWAALVSIVPMMALVVLFAASTVWFVALAIRGFRDADRRSGLHFTGHSLMFAAMTWHLAAMAVMHASHQGTHGETMPGMGAAHQPAVGPIVFAVVGVPLMSYLLFASVVAIRDITRPAAMVDDTCACGSGCRCGADCACSTGHAVVADPVAITSGDGGTAVLVAATSSSLSCHEERPVGSVRFRLAAASDFAMNFGMFWMSTGIMVPLLPFFALFAF